MKILHVTAQLPSGTGSGVYYSNVIEELKKYGHEQAAIFACQDDYDFGFLGRSSQYPVCFKSERIPFPIAGMSDVMPYENTIYSSMDEDMIRIWRDAFEEILKLAKSEFMPEVLILHHLWILTSMAVKIFDEQVKIGVCHNTEIRQAEQHPEMKIKYVTNLKCLNAVFSLSDPQKQRVSDVFGFEQNKVITIGGGFNQKLFYPVNTKKKNKIIRIIYAAKIERSKGVFELVKAFKKLNEVKSNVCLEIIGSPNSENAHKLISLIGTAKNIDVVPIKSQNELAGYIRDADIFVMPSYFEGLGLMAIECLASGLRVVATEIEALISLLGKAVNDSGVIEYVKLPRIYNTDNPFEEDIGQFIENLYLKLLVQVERIEKDEEFPQEVLSEISRHSWSGVAEKINNEIIRICG